MYYVNSNRVIAWSESDIQNLGEIFLDFETHIFNIVEIYLYIFLSLIFPKKKRGGEVSITMNSKSNQKHEH